MGAAASSLFWTKRSDHGDFIIAAANGDAEKCLAIINRAPGTPFAPFDERDRPLFTDEDHAAQLNMPVMILRRALFLDWTLWFIT